MSEDTMCWLLIVGCALVTTLLIFAFGQDDYSPFARKTLATIAKHRWLS